MNNTKDTYENIICTFGNVRELKKIRDFIQSKAERFGFSNEEAQKIALAVDEACTNLIKHAFNYDNSRNICVQIETGKNQFTVSILDDGAPFNPIEVEEMNKKEYFENYKQGGLGIQIMRKIMDDISYTPSDGSNPKNILKLKKVLA